MNRILKLLAIICLSSISACATLQSITTGGNTAVPTLTPVQVPDNYVIGETTIARTTIDRVVSVEPVILPNCRGSSDLTVRHTFTQQVDRTPELIDFDEVRFNLSVQSVIGNISTGLGVDPGEGNPLLESYELEMSAAPGTSVEYRVEWVLTSKTGVIEFVSDEEVVYVEFTAPETLRAIPQEPTRKSCPEETEST